MPFPDDADDDAGFVPPLPPDDRLWLHPSERAASRGAAPVSTPHRRRRPRSRRVATGMFLAVAGILLVVAGTMPVVDLLRTDDTAGRSASGATSGDAAASSEVLDRISPALVRVTAERPDGTWTTTGLIVRPDGHLVTTADAIIGATSVTVRVADGSTFNARIVGTDRADDIAVLDIATNDGITVRFADVSTPGAGDPAFVIGRNRDGSRWSSTASIDGLRQRLTANDGSVLLGMIRTVLPAPPAVGSAVVCATDGTVLGILTARTQMAGASTGSPTATVATNGRAVSYATPIAWVTKIVDEIIATGTFHRTWIGIIGEDVPTGGAVVRSVVDGGPAARAGIVDGDVVVSVDEEPVTSADDLALDVRARRPGDRVMIVIERDGARSSMSVELSDQT